VERPLGVIAIAVLFFAVAGYLATVGTLKLLWPDAISLSLGSQFLHGLELWGPFMFLIAAAAGAAIGIGLLRLNNLARRVAAMVAIAGMALLIPKVSAEASDFSWRFAFAAASIMVRVMIVWYLWQSWTAEKFVRK
jgi:hypothetical protein